MATYQDARRLGQVMNVTWGQRDTKTLQGSVTQTHIPSIRSAKTPPHCPPLRRGGELCRRQTSGCSQERRGRRGHGPAAAGAGFATAQVEERRSYRQHLRLHRAASRSRSTPSSRSSRTAVPDSGSSPGCMAHRYPGELRSAIPEWTHHRTQSWQEIVSFCRRALGRGNAACPGTVSASARRCGAPQPVLRPRGVELAHAGGQPTGRPLREDREGCNAAAPSAPFP